MKIKVTFLSALLSLSVLTVFFQSPQATGGAITGTMLVGSIIEQLEGSISNVVSQLDNHVSARAFQIRMELIFLQEAIAKSGEQLIGKTFEELSLQQQLFFENATKTIQSVESNIDKVDTEVDNLATQVEQIAAQIPFFGEQPRLRESSPLYLLSSKATQEDTVVSINGSFLKHGNAELYFGDAACELLGHNDSNIRFSCPGTVFSPTTDKVISMSAKLVLGDEISFFEKVGTWFGSDQPTTKYTLPFHVIPDNLGRFKLVSYYGSQRREERNRRGDFGRTNKHCRHTQSYEYNFGPESPEWRIDTSSIRTRTSCSRRGSHSILNSSGSGFQIRTTASNSGSCEEILGRVVAYDGRGCEAGTVSWTEYKIQPVTASSALGNGVLQWGQDVSFQLPNNFQSFLLSVVLIDGKKIELNQAVGSDWFNVSRDAANNTIVISPKSLHLALKQ